MVRPSLRKEMAQWAVQYRSASVRFACRTFGISETCYRYHPKLNDENELIADWLVTLTDAKKAWGFGLCFLHLRNVKGFGWILSPGRACLRAREGTSVCTAFIASWS